MSGELKSKTMNIAKTKKKGFSIGEVLLSAFVLSVGMVAVVQLVSVAIRESSGSQDVIIGAQLAQEGVELVRNVRDNNFAQNDTDPLTSDPTGYPFQTFPSGSSSDCRFDNNLSSIECGSGTDFSLKLSPTTGYNHTSGMNTKFSRKVVITDISGGKTVTSIVMWGSTSPSWPSVSAISNGCTAGTKCAFSQITLTGWK